MSPRRPEPDDHYAGGPREGGGMTRLRAYLVSHYARTEITNIVAARNLKEAVEQDEAGNYIDEGWAGEAFPMRGRPKARRYPLLDALASRDAPREDE